MNQLMHDNRANEVVSKCNKLLLFLASNMEDVLKILTEYETYPTAIDELTRTCNTLGNIESELHFLTQGSVSKVATFLPQNQPLYALTLFAVVPALTSREVHVRPPVAMRSVMNKLIQLIPNNLFETVFIHSVTRREFIERHVCDASVVIFTGRYENAVQILSVVSQSALFIYNGAGINPFIIGKDSNVELALRKGIAARLYNSGQDCAGPDIFFIHSSQWDFFLEGLIRRLQRINVGQNDEIDTFVGPLIEDTAVKRVRAWLDCHSGNILFGGQFDAEKNLVFPTVVKMELAECSANFELFAPIFKLTQYDDDTELLKFFNSKNYRDYAMYASIFGSLDIGDSLSNSTIILAEKSLLDYERGNLPFGGYGRKGTFIRMNGHQESRPVLISKEIASYITGG